MDSIDIAARRPAIGVAGLGRMGAPIAAILSRTFSTRAFDIDPGRRAAVAGVTWSDSIRDLADGSDVLVTVLPGVPEMRQCLAEALPALRPGAMWLDLTSGDPSVTRELAAQAERRGVAVVSAPMGGSVPQASAGELIFFVSGADGAVERALGILRELAARDGVRRAGSRPEDGQIVKLLANGLWFANAVAASEAMLIGQELGLATGTLHDLLRTSAGGSRFIDEHLGMLLDGDYLETFGIDRVVEELDTVSAMARDARVTTPMLDASAVQHRAALSRFGPALGELLAVRLLEEQAGRLLRR
jgi:3-hydroxyisobutyrate dehydrogenase-like beta-hydroxyacid dehydrogenase